MSDPTCSRPEYHAEYHAADGTCSVCAEVATWPAPTPEQVEVMRRCLPPLTPEQQAELAQPATAESEAAA